MGIADGVAAQQLLHQAGLIHGAIIARNFRRGNFSGGERCPHGASTGFPAINNGGR